jgi:hypothetical protein
LFEKSKPTQSWTRISILVAQSYIPRVPAGPLGLKTVGLIGKGCFRCLVKIDRIESVLLPIEILEQ